MTDAKDARKNAIVTALAIAEEITAGTLPATNLDSLAADECRQLVGRVEGPDDPLWELHVDITRQVLAVGGGISADELAEWVAVYRAAEADAAAELAAELAAGRGPSWIEQALADDGGSDEVDNQDGHIPAT